MTKEVIAVDVDEVLFPFLDEFIVYHNPQFGTSLDLSQFTNYEFHGPLNLSIPDTVERIYTFTHISKDMQIEPINQAKESISELSELYKLVVVTARNPKFEEITKNWLEEHFPGRFSSLEMIGYAPIMEKPISKVDICKKIGATALIDDSLFHLVSVAEAEIQGVLFGDYPWNQCDVLPEGVVRKETWADILEYFKKA